VRERFCIDREEYVKPGDALPLAHQSWTSAGAICESRGARLCKESEWQFACEGEEMRPYPYGFSRDSAACNIDQMKLGKPQSGLNDLRAPISAYPGCLSPFGVHDMSGNVEEWATLDHGRAPDRSTMKGAWWLPGKNNCRARTLGHGEVYEGPQVGVRCCEDAASAKP
jgi:formylglycine-generating enzyme